MTDILGKLPRWVLLVLICLLTPLAVYALTQHVTNDQQQTTDIASLSATVSNLVVVVEYNYKETERNRDTTEVNSKNIRDAQMRLERILGRIEARLDEEND